MQNICRIENICCFISCSTKFHSFKWFLGIIPEFLSLSFRTIYYIFRQSFNPFEYEYNEY